MLGCKLHSGTSKTKELVPAQPGCPFFLNSASCDRIFSLIFLLKKTSSSTLNNIVNHPNNIADQVVSTLLGLTYSGVSFYFSLHPDSNNHKDPCCDSTAVTSLSGCESVYRDSSEGRRQLNCRWPKHGVHDQPRVEHHSGTKGVSPNYSSTGKLRW